MALIIRRHSPFVFIIAVVIVLTATSLSCAPHYVDDPIAGTPGFKMFTSRVPGFRISFEYPDTWRRLSVEGQGEGKWIFLYPTESSISISSDALTNAGGEFDNPNQLIQHELEREPFLPEFQIIRKGNVQLGQEPGKEVVYSYRYMRKDDPHLPPGTAIDKLVVERSIAAEHKGRIYHVNALIDNDDEVTQQSFEHLITTFRFLD
jgi:hypothetical protein